MATSGTEGMSTAQWTTLQTFEQQFSVRQLTAYAVPSSDYGLATASHRRQLLVARPSPVLTSDGATCFRISSDRWTSIPAPSGYEATPLPAPTRRCRHARSPARARAPCSGIYTTPDGARRCQTFNQNQFSCRASSCATARWTGWRGRVLRRPAQLPRDRHRRQLPVRRRLERRRQRHDGAHSTDYNPADALREVPADVTQRGNWSRPTTSGSTCCSTAAAACGRRRRQLVGAGDGGSGGTGSTGSTGGTGPAPIRCWRRSGDRPGDRKAYTGDFGWISHTWDHPNIDKGCATQNYIEAELNQNTAWGAKRLHRARRQSDAGGLGLTASTDPTAALGNRQPVGGRHRRAFRAGQPAAGQPRVRSTRRRSTTQHPAADATSTLPAGDYVYAVTDQFNTAGRGRPRSPAPVSRRRRSPSPVTVAAGQSVGLTWGAVCHAADYIDLPRAVHAPVARTTGTIGAWSRSAR